MNNIDILSKNLSTYSQEANNSSTAIAQGLLPLGFIILTIFFAVELINWKQLLERRNKKINISIFIEFGYKYFLGVILIMSSGYIIDAVMELSIIILKKVNSIYPPSSYNFTFEEVDLDGIFLDSLINATGWVLERISKVILYALIFIRYIDLYFLKAIAPIMIGFYYSDEFRPAVINFFKTFITYALLSVVLLIITILYGMIMTEDVLKDLASNDDSWTAVLFILRGIIYCVVLVGATRKIKSLIGVQ